MSVNPMRGEVDFPGAGEDCVIRVTNADMAAIQKQFGDHWFDTLMNRLSNYDMNFIAFVLKLSARKDGVPTKFDFLTANGMLIADVTRKLTDAVFLAIHGMTFEDYLNDFEVKARARKEKSDPQNRPDDSSTS